MEGDGCSPLEMGKAWSRIASNVPDPPNCIEECRVRFFESVVQGYDDSKLSEVCGILSKDDGARELLWNLYCCNSSSCGVKSEMGQDPGVNWVINVCQNSGIQDPGPPSLGHLCPVTATPKDCQKPGFLISDSRPRPTAPTSAPMPPSMFPTAAGSATQSSRLASGTSTATTLKDSGEQTKSVLPVGPRIAIGICGAFTLIAVVAVAICVYRRRSRRGYTQSLKSIRSEIKHHTLPEACSPTPFAPFTPPAAPMQEKRPSSTKTTPPPPLRERKLLPTPPAPTASEAGGSAPATPASSLAPSTINLPRSRYLAKRDSSFSARQNRLPRSPFSPPSTIFQGKELRTASLSSLATTSRSSLATTSRTATTVSNASSSFPYMYPAPPSPSRPPRPHGKPLRAPDLVCPGPPPNRALPPPPPPPPSVSPVSPGALLRQYSTDSGHNVSMALANGFVPPRNPARGVVVLGKDSSDFCELTESYARESRDRDSWGSWSVGAGGTGIGSSSVQRGGGRVNSPVLAEADLERMGGRY